MSEKQNPNKRKAPKTAFKPGQSGNPAGRPPKGLAFRDILNTKFDEMIGNVSRRDILIEKCISMAIDGSIPMIELMLNYLYGKPIEHIETKEVKDEVVIE